MTTAAGPTTIVFGTDGWRARVADEFTFENVRRCADGVAQFVMDRGEQAKGVRDLLDAVRCDPTYAAACPPGALERAWRGDLSGAAALCAPLDPGEVSSALGHLARAEAYRQRGDFTTSMSLVMRRLLLDPEFLFRVEVGTPAADPNTYGLGPYELAARLSFFILGRAPSEALRNE